MQSFRLKVLDSFHCLGGQCTFNCCQGWKIALDTTTAAKWEALEPTKLKQSLLAAVDKKIEDSGEKLSLCMDAKGRCVLLDETGLCSVHKHSENLLPSICRDYPRTNCNYGSRSLVTANLSCPEIVRLVLTTDTKDQFQITEGGPSEAVFFLEGNEQVSLQIESFVKQAMAEQRFPLATRITGIAEILVHLAVKSQQSGARGLGMTEVQRLCAKPKQRIYEIREKSKLKQLKPAPSAAGRFWKFIASMLDTKQAQIYLGPELTQSLLVQQAVAAKTEAECEAFYREVMSYRDKAAFELTETYQPYGEKYLSVKFVNSGFPNAPTAGNYIATFLYCIFPYALVQFIFWLLAAQKGKIADLDVINIITRVDRLLSHNNHVYSYLDQNPGALRLDLYYPCLLEL